MLNLDGRSAVADGRTIGTIQVVFSSIPEEENEDTFIGHFHAGVAEWIDAQFGEGGTGESPKAPRPIKLDLEDQLLIPTTIQVKSLFACQNSSRDNGWIRDDSRARNTLVNRNTSFLNRLGQLCIESKIYICGNEACVRNRERMEKVIPSCKWTSFQDWALGAMSCQAYLRQQKKKLGHILTL